MRLGVLGALLLVGAINYGCTTPASRRQSSSVDAPSATVVTADELARVVGSGSILVALERVRPSMLAGRGGASPFVSIDGSPPGDFSLLRSVPVSSVRQVQLVRASSSVARPAVADNGDIVVGDLILVLTRTGRTR